METRQYQRNRQGKGEQGCQRTDSFALVLGGNGRFILVPTTPVAHSVLQFLALFRRQLFPALVMPASVAAVAANPPEQDLAQHQDADGLQVTDLLDAEE